MVILLTIGFTCACGDNIPLVDAPLVPDAKIDSPPCQPSSTLESLTFGDLLIDVAQTSAAASIAVPLERSVLFVTVRENEASPRYGGVVCELHGADAVQMIPAGVTCARNTAGTDTGSGQIAIHWTLATFATGVTVQRGETDTHVANPALITLLTPVVPSQTFVLLGGMFNDGSGWGNNEFVRAQLVDATTLDLRTNSPGTQVGWQVVSMAGASVQRGTASLASADLQHAVTLPNPAEGLVLLSYTTDNASGIAAASMMLQATRLPGNTLMLERGLGGSSIDASWELASLPFLNHAATTTFAATETTKTEPVAGLAAETSAAIGSNQAILGNSSGSTSYAGSDLDLPGEAAATLTTQAGAVVLQRGSSQATTSITWTAIDFSRNQCAGI